MPPSLQDWLPEHHLARFIADVAETLDLSQIYSVYERNDGRGMAAYHPLLLTRLLLYAYCVGKPSSRQIEKATFDDLAFRYLSSDQHPDHDTIAAFRQEHLAALSGLFLQALRMCREAGLVKLGHVALDGTKIRAQASPEANLRYPQLAERERALSERVRQLLEEAARIDAEEDSRYGKGRRGDELPEELATAEKRLAKLHGAKEKIVAAADVVTDNNDRHQLAPMARRAAANLAVKPATLTADAGYWNEEALTAATLDGIAVLVPPNSTEPRHGGRPLPANAPRSERAHKMRERLAQGEGRALHAMRKAIVEPVFAHIKERRGFRRFSMRGLGKVRAEWSLICTTHNLIKLHRHRTAAARS